MTRLHYIKRLPLVLIFLTNMILGQHDSLSASYKHRVIISTDIGGTDPDDFQSMVHLLVYSD